MSTQGGAAGSERTAWPRVLLLLGVGVVAALHIGKVPPALPLLKAELGLTLPQAGLLVSMFNFVGALAGLFCGALAERFGVRRSMLAGLLLMALASAAGTQAQGLAPLLALRLLEGLAFMLTVTAVPSQMLRATAPEEHRMVMALWGTYMPAGMAVMMLMAAPLLAVAGWRAGWWAGALAALLWAALATWAGPGPAPGQVVPPRLPARELLRAALRPRPLALAACFLCYAAQFLAVMGFLPTLLVQVAGFGVAAAGLTTAVVVVANATGNVIAGALAQRGWPAPRVLALAALAMGLCGAGVFVDVLPLGLRIALAFGFSTIGGLLPGTLMGAAAAHAPHPAMAGAAIGLLLQGAGMGQVIGPPLLGALVQGSGTWAAGALFCVVLAPLAAAAGRFGAGGAAQYKG